jgi:trk system potassium uptake protein TrkH
VGLLYGAVWLATDRGLHRTRRAIPAAVSVIAIAGAVITHAKPGLSLTCLVPMPLSILLAACGAKNPTTGQAAAGAGIWNAIADHPARLLSATFLALIVGGTAALALPVCAARAKGISVVDAAFTAVSATCVTGLTAVDTATAFSAIGQGAVLALIQLGGLGIMTFYTAGLALFGRRLALKQEAAMAGILGDENRRDLGRSLRQVLILTFAFELLGACALTGLFLAHGDPMGAATWRGVFTAISAFCNAGFALQSDNLIAFQRDPLVLHVVAVLIVAGGLGPAVIAAVPALVRRRRVPLQAKVVLAASAILLVGGAILFAAFEWSRSLAGLPLLDRLHNAWFQSVTTRTAGFNSVDMGAMGPASVVIVIVLMFVGGSPGSTAGGIKTTTAAVLFAAVRAALRGRPEVTIFKRTVPHFTVYKAAAIGALYSAVAIAAVIVLQLTQPLEPMSAIFEVVSALGTVGLSVGGTAQLDGAGKIAIMACMFLGRIGPLTLFMVLADRRAQGRWRLPEEDVSTG